MIKELEDNFALVLITEYMLPSLLLMKRMYVWISASVNENV